MEIVLSECHGGDVSNDDVQVADGWVSPYRYFKKFTSCRRNRFVDPQNCFKLVCQMGIFVVINDLFCFV